MHYPLGGVSVATHGLMPNLLRFLFAWRVTLLSDAQGRSAVNWRIVRHSISPPVPPSGQISRSDALLTSIVRDQPAAGLAASV